MSETYEGWSNRETWAANLWLSNDEGLYSHTRELAAGVLFDAFGDVHEARYALGEALREMFDDWAADIVDGEPTTREVRSMILDIGSLYRVDWHEVAEGWIASAAEEAEAES